MIFEPGILGIDIHEKRVSAFRFGRVEGWLLEVRNSCDRGWECFLQNSFLLVFSEHAVISIKLSTRRRALRGGKDELKYPILPRTLAEMDPLPHPSRCRSID
jgi:hypothetical protein